MLARVGAERYTDVRTAGLARIARAGVGGALAYVVEMWLDELVFREPTDDLVLLGGLLSQHPLRSRAWGLVLHGGNGILVATVYAATVRSRLTGPAWSRGVALAIAENTLLWPLVIALDSIHPWIRTGRLPRYNRGVPWLQAALRHAAFGAVMGSLLGVPPRDERRRGEARSIATRPTMVISSSSSDTAGSSAARLPRP